MRDNAKRKHETKDRLKCIKQTRVQWDEDTVDDVVAGNNEVTDAEEFAAGTMLLLAELVAVDMAGVVRAARIERSDMLSRCVTGGTRERVAGRRAVSLRMSLNNSSSCARTSS